MPFWHCEPGIEEHIDGSKHSFSSKHQSPSPRNPLEHRQEKLPVKKSYILQLGQTVVKKQVAVLLL